MKLSCVRAYSLLLDFLETALPAELHHSMRTHLSECQACSRMVATYDKTRRLCQNTLCTQLPQGAGDKLLQALRDKLRPKV